METQMNQEIQIVEAKLQNLEQLATIARRSFFEAYPQNTDHENMELYLKEAFSEEEIKSQLLHPDSIFFIMKNGTTFLGYAKMRWDRPHGHFKGEKAIELERFYFLNEFKGKGYGSRLLQFCIDYAVTNQFEWMWLLVWEENLTGLQFYKHKGFELFDRKIFQFGNANSDDILMKRRL